ncbi:hypothetical protein OIY81_631 [Cryptosporidium canis]|uniref:F-actin-capping protein subunit alpha n=1 Tax=Cryptosporidium canis TaxID=195482 RepID=A0ABQ8P3A8_9CRYT|nr:hypothetical protein OJ252_3270 [Cryptosporidium canis]KAJ1614251.1 hypothetical protein OIY81_631 [Cryptosporidium canis]
MEEQLEIALENICENSAPGVAIGILDKFRYHFEDVERGQDVIERISKGHLEKFSLLFPIKNLDMNVDTIFWGVINRYSRVNEDADNRVYKYIDPLFSIKAVIQPSTLEVVDVEKMDFLSVSRLSQFRKELENVFIDTQSLNFIRGDGSNMEIDQSGYFEKLDFKDFKLPLRRTVVYDSELLPKIGLDKKDTLIIVRSSANLKYCSNKTGSWHSEWKFEFPENDSQGDLIWTGCIHIHSYNSELGNSHLIYKKEKISVNITSGKYSTSELLKVSEVLYKMLRSIQMIKTQDPVLFAKQTSAVISEKERSIQSKLSNTVSQFKNIYIKKLRRALPINPNKFDWGRYYSPLQDPLNESILTSTNF